MTKRIAFMMVILLAAAPLLLAQHHQNMTEKKISDEVTFAQSVRIGDATLKAGTYRVICDHVSMTFINQSNGEKVLQVPCKGKELDAKAKSTEIYLAKAADGASVVEKLLLKGSTIEHVF